ncbi:MAG: membrane protein [Phycisphaerae bacterium]|nr:MAG: membrane protein [Phycisphaerae bacterium]
MPALQPPEYPSIFVAADRAAIARQREFVFMMVAQLVLLVAVTIVTNIATAGLFKDEAGNDRISGPLSVVSAALLFVTLVLSFFLRHNNPDERWFQCRALAENTKCLAWYYAMGAPLPGAGSRDERFVNAVGELRKRLTRTRHCLADEGVGSAWITPWMRSLAGASLQERLATLRTHRIADQCAWYDRKSKFNASRDSVFYGLVFALEVAALALAAWFIVRQVDLGQVDAVFQLGYPGIFATVAASCIAWTQFRRYGDLITTYSIAADDLRLIEAAAHSLEVRLATLAPDAAEAEFQTLVQRAEAAISREHSVWLGPNLP